MGLGSKIVARIKALREPILQILEKAEVTLRNDDMFKVTRIINREILQLAESDKSYNAAQTINKDLDDILTRYDKLQPFERHLRHAFVEMVSTEPAKELLKDTFNEKGKNFAAPELDEIVENFRNISMSRGFTRTMGDKNAQEFSQQVEKLAKVYYNYNLSGEERRETLLKNMASLKEWAITKEEVSKGSTFSKIATVISSYTKAVGARLIGDKDAYQKNMDNASEVIRVLDPSILKYIAKEATTSTQKIKTLQNEKKSSKSAVAKLQDEKNKSPDTIISR